MKRVLSLVVFLGLIMGLHAAQLNLVWSPETSGTSGLPDEVKVYRTTSSLNGRGFAAWYAIADLSTGKIELRCKTGTSQKLSSFMSNMNGDAYVGVNGGYFYSGASLSLVTDLGLRKAVNLESVTRGDYTYNITRGAMGVNAQQSPSCGWSYTINGSNWLYPTPLTQIEGTAPLAAPNATTPSGGQKWGEYSAMGGGPLLVKDGVLLVDYTQSGGFYQKNYELFPGDIFGTGVRQPRTAMGYTADGKMVLFVCDGRNQNGSTGATLEEVAQIMIEIGCTNVLNLDGGGSSEMMAGTTVLNSPSDGTERSIVSAVLFAKTAPESEFAQMKQTRLWNSTVLAPHTPEWFYGATSARDIAAFGDKVFIPIRSGGTYFTSHGVRVINANTGELIKTLSTTGITGGAHVISSIQTTSDGVVLVCNLTTDFGAANPFKIYAYTSLDADPIVLLNFPGSASSGLTTGKRIGDTFTYEGSFQKGTIRAVSYNVNTNGYYEWKVENGAIVNLEPTFKPFYKNDGTTPWGDLGRMARIYPDPDGTTLWARGSVTASTFRPLHFDANGVNIGSVDVASLKSPYGNTARPFIFKGRKYMAVVDYSGGTVMDKSVGTILDITDSDAGVPKFEVALGTATNTNGTDGVAVIVGDVGFQVFFLSAVDGVMAYQFGETLSTDAPKVEMENMGVQFFPNPAKEGITFTAPVERVTISTLAGNIVFQSDLPLTYLPLTLPQGAYVIEYRGVNSSQQIAKILLIQ